jgi:hypothetical protein
MFWHLKVVIDNSLQGIKPLSGVRARAAQVEQEEQEEQEEHKSQHGDRHSNGGFTKVETFSTPSAVGPSQFFPIALIPQNLEV